MSNSKFEYVKSFESNTELLKNTYIVIRIDGKGFTQFCDQHGFTKPNDIRGIKLMNLSALTVTKMFNEIFLAYGQSDEYSFVFRKDTKIYNRRSEKILTYVVSAFTSAYVFYWNKVFTDIELKFPPVFDGRVILYPCFENLKDYLSWRQVDCHINNLYNTTFWALVLMGNLSKEEAHNKLKGTFSKDKHEILYKEFQMNYNFIEDIYKRGTIIFKKMRMEEEDNKNKSKFKNVKNIKENELLNEQITNEVNFNIKSINLNEEKETETLISLTDSLLRKDEKYLEILKTFYDQNIFITHEDVIQDEFWKKYNLK